MTRLQALDTMRKSLEGLLEVRKDGGEQEGAPQPADATTAHQALPEAIQGRLADFFRVPGDHPDSEYHALAEELGIAPDQAETFAYGLLSSLLAGGKSAGKDVQADEAQVEAGMKVEAEHSDHPVIRRKIVQDHLEEDPEYYTKLGTLNL